MYRQYEDPFKLEDQLAEMKAEYQDMIDSGADPEDLADAAQDIAEMEDRIRFAWDDDEADRDACDF